MRTAASIAAKLGGRKIGNGWLVYCVCHANTNTPALSLRDGDVGLLLYCHAGCSTLDILHELRRRGLIDGDAPRRRAPAPVAKPSEPDDTIRIKRALEIWSEARPVSDTLGEVYLTKRGLVLPADAEMRFHTRCPRGSIGRQPAIVWLLRDIQTNEPRAIQRRFLKPDGAKDGAAMSLGPSGGTVWKLSADEDVCAGLGIVEGHADALAILNSGWAPIWATSGTSAMASFPVLGGIDALTVFVDNDGPGRKAAETCADRWLAAGREVGIVEPTHAKDFAAMVEP